MLMSEGFKKKSNTIPTTRIRLRWAMGDSSAEELYSEMCLQGQCPGQFL